MVASQHEHAHAAGLLIQEYCEECENNERTVRRPAHLTDNSSLPAMLQQIAGDNIYDGLRNGFRVSPAAGRVFVTSRLDCSRLQNAVLVLLRLLGRLQACPRHLHNQCPAYLELKADASHLTDKKIYMHTKQSTGQALLLHDVNCRCECIVLIRCILRARRLTCLHHLGQTLACKSWPGLYSSCLTHLWLKGLPSRYAMLQQLSHLPKRSI